mgnify:CR=1 FL=1
MESKISWASVELSVLRDNEYFPARISDRLQKLDEFRETGCMRDSYFGTPEEISHSEEPDLLGPASPEAIDWDGFPKILQVCRACHLVEGVCVCGFKSWEFVPGPTPREGAHRVYISDYWGTAIPHYGRAICEGPKISKEERQNWLVAIRAALNLGLEVTTAEGESEDSECIFEKCIFPRGRFTAEQTRILCEFGWVIAEHDFGREKAILFGPMWRVLEKHMYEEMRARLQQMQSPDQNMG